MRPSSRSSSSARLERRPVARWKYADADTPKVRQIGSTPKRARCSSMNALTSDGLRRPPGQNHRGGFEDLIRAPQLIVLAPQLADLLPLARRRQIRPRAVLSLSAAHTLAQHLRTDTEILGDMRDRTPGLQHEPNTPIEQFFWVLSCSGHRRGASPSARTSSWPERSPRNPGWLSRGRGGERAPARRANGRGPTALLGGLAH